MLLLRGLSRLGVGPRAAGAGKALIHASRSYSLELGAHKVISIKPPAAARGFASRVRKECEADGCTTQPSYGLKGTFGSAHATHCRKHMDPATMEDVRNKRCAADGCTTRASFGPKGTFGTAHATHLCNDLKHTRSKKGLNSRGAIYARSASIRPCVRVGGTSVKRRHANLTNGRAALHQTRRLPACLVIQLPVHVPSRPRRITMLAAR